MRKDTKIVLSIAAAIFIAGASLTYGASTAPKSSPTKTSTPTIQSKPAKQQPPKQDNSEEELKTIESILVAAYPKISTDYSINKGQFFNENQWYGTTLTYKSGDVDNRDTLRVLFQKKNGEWKLRTTPPEPLLSAKKYKDVPVTILKAINKPVSLPAGNTNSPVVNAAE